MADKDYEGVVTSLAVPVTDLACGKPHFVFSMLNPTCKPPGGQDVPVFYLSFEKPFAKQVMALVLAAYQTGVAVQVGLIPGEKMQVNWVQLPRSPAEV